MMIDDEDSKHELIEQAKMLLRAAAWLSKMDTTGGPSANSAERKAILETIRKFEREKDYKTLRSVFEVALDHYKAWDEWGRDVSGFTRELKAAAAQGLSLVHRQCIYDLAYCVAIRYRERSLVTAIGASIYISLRNFLGLNPNRIELPAYLNISVAEKSALNEIAELLTLPQRVIV